LSVFHSGYVGMQVSFTLFDSVFRSSTAYSLLMLRSMCILFKTRFSADAKFRFDIFSFLEDDCGVFISSIGISPLCNESKWQFLYKLWLSELPAIFLDELCVKSSSFESAVFVLVFFASFKNCEKSIVNRCRYGLGSGMSS